MNKTEKIWRKHLNNLEKKFSLMLGRKTEIVPITGDDLGYTMPGKRTRIMLNYQHEIVPMELKKALYFVDGVGFHELCHQLFTDFNKAESFRNEMMKSGASNNEVQLFHQFFNIVEDSSIEYWGIKKFGGYLPQALQYSIQTIWKASGKLSEANSAFEQYTYALIQFGDVGLPKGNFTFPEAEQMFKETIGIFNDAIESPCAEERIQASYQIFLKTKPLWEEMIKRQDEFEEFMKQLQQQAKDSGMNQQSPQGCGEYSDDANAMDGENDNNETNKDEDGDKQNATTARRKAVIKKFQSKNSQSDNSQISDNSESKEENNSNPQSCSGSGKSIDSNANDKNDDSNKNALTAFNKSADFLNDDSSSDSNSEPDNCTDSDNSQISDNKSDDIDDESSTDELTDAAFNANESDNQQDSEDEQNSDESSDSVSDSNSNMDLNKEMADLENDELSSQTAKELEEQLNGELKDVKKEEEIENDDSEPLEIPVIKGKAFNEASCYNKKISKENNDEKKYNDFYENVIYHSKKLANRLKRALEQEPESRQHTTNGRVDVKRLSTGKQTSRVFNRRNVPDSQDMAVLLLIDESGSMYHRINFVKSTVIGLAETMAMLNTPLYVMGFSGDYCGCNAYQRHYIKWKNTPTTRKNLTQIDSFSTTFLGYSLRYASEILKKRPEENKLLLVLTDGYPTLPGYGWSNEDALGDCAAAIRQADRSMLVHGIAIGEDIDPNYLKAIFGVNFTYEPNIENLFGTLGKVLYKRIQKI